MVKNVMILMQKPKQTNYILGTYIIWMEYEDLHTVPASIV